jgi:hypothetical protein
MPQCQVLFSAVIVFQKSYTGNILGMGRNESQKKSLQRIAPTKPKKCRRLPIAPIGVHAGRGCHEYIFPSINPKKIPR